jgi:hypothetical protein
MEKLRIRSIGTFSTFPPSYFLAESSCVVLDAARVATPDDERCCWDTPDDETTVDTTGDGASCPAAVLALALAL